MPRSPKYTEVMTVLERRIRRGDYLLDSLPGERTIAAETGVSHMTARKAVQALIHKQVLSRAANGTLEVNPQFQASARVAQVVMLYPAYPSPFLTQLRQTALAATRKHGLELRPVQYVHWDEPVVMDAVNHEGGTIIIPASTDVPERIRDTMRRSRCVSLDIDLSHHGIKSVRLFPDQHIRRLLNHLKRQGHTCVHCLSTHTRNAEIERRIDLWKDWKTRENLDGELWENPAPSFEDPAPLAHQTMRPLINKKVKPGDAVVATTFPAAMGAARAAAEGGLRVGEDLSVCAVNIESPAKFTTPTIAGLDTPGLAPILKDCFDWFAGEEPWPGPDLIEPQRIAFYRGESIISGKTKPRGRSKANA